MSRENRKRRVALAGLCLTLEEAFEKYMYSKEK